MKIHDLIVKPLKMHIDHRGFLVEGWRSDSSESLKPEMMYVSYSNPGIRRGAHKHINQKDYFIFIGPGNFRVVIIDDRSDSPTYKMVDDFYVGENNPAAVLIPTNCWHGYQNISSKMGMVINLPDKMYKGPNYSEDIDEIRMKWENIYDWPEIED